MDSYGKYKNARNASWQCLIDCGITSLPVSLTQLGTRLDIRLYRYSQNAGLIRDTDLAELLGADGFSLQGPSGRLMVFFNDSRDHHRIRFTVAHEYGHILLGHVDRKLCSRGALISAGNAAQERDANIFASRLLAPACVLWGCGASTAEDISRLCDISLQTAAIRAERMELLRQRGAWLRSPLEQQVYAQFQKYIETYKI